MQWTAPQLFFLATGVLLGAAAVGALRAASNLMGVTHILFLGLENIVPARAAQHFRHGGVKALKGYLLRVSWTGGLVTAFVAGVFAVAPGFWLDLFYGGSYARYGYVVQFFAAVYILMFMGVPLRAGLRALEQNAVDFLGFLVGEPFFPRSDLSVDSLVRIVWRHGGTADRPGDNPSEALAGVSVENGGADGMTVIYLVLGNGHPYPKNDIDESACTLVDWLGAFLQGYGERAPFHLQQLDLWSETEQ